MAVRPGDQGMRVAVLAVLLAIAVFAHGTTEKRSGAPIADAFTPTAALPLLRVTTESEPAAMLVVSLPGRRVFGDADKERFFRELIETAAQYVDVALLVDRDESFARQNIRSLFDPRYADRVTIEPAVIDTEWIRDYAPFFGVGRSGAPVLLDAMTRDLQREAETERSLTALGLVKTPGRAEQDLSDYGHFWRQNDDAAASYFGQLLSRQGEHIIEVRPPLQLAGGDVAFSESGHMLTSTRTLDINGGDARRLRRLARDYFNVNEVVFLRPLPETIWHIDMFVRVVGSNRVLIADIQKGTDATGRIQSLQQRAAAVIEANRELLQAAWPALEFIPVPMPIEEKAPTRLERTGRTGVAVLDDAVDRTGARFTPVSTAVYRSFVNSVFLNGGTGPSAVLVPRFAGFEHLEPAVKNAYRQAYPGAEIHFINADPLLMDFGGIHCVTAVIPSYSGY